MPNILIQGSGAIAQSHATHMTTFDHTRLGDFPPQNSFLFVWANRFKNNITPKDNPPIINIDGKDYRFRFSNLTKANLATIALIRSAYVSNQSARILCTNNNLRAVEWGDINSLRALRKPDGYFLDVALILPQPVNALSAGFVLDYEVQDGRSPSATLNFFNRLKVEFPLIRRLMYANNLLSAGATKSGLNGIEIRLPGIFHGSHILLTGDKFDALAQRKLFGASRNLYITLDMKQTKATLTRAREFVEREKLLGINVWRNGEPNLQQKLDLFASWKP